MLYMYLAELYFKAPLFLCLGYSVSMQAIIKISGENTHLLNNLCIEATCITISIKVLLEFGSSNISRIYHFKIFKIHCCILKTISAFI